MLDIVLGKEANRVLAAMPRNTSRRIMAKIEQYARHPGSLVANVRALVGQDALRLRVGNWRVLFIIEDNTMTVFKVASRGSAYD